jgi:biotin-[acetyl-CoA-carboxylase] ligase BirA-like protein
MVIYTDSEGLAREMFPNVRSWRPLPSSDGIRPEALRDLALRLFRSGAVFRSDQSEDPGTRKVLCVAHSPFSQFDLVVELSGAPAVLPDGLVCLAGSGSGFHGQRGRPWAAEPGNLHLTLHWRPERMLMDQGLGFSVLAAVSVVECLDGLPGLSARPGIKWVNDILLDSAKVAGFVAHIQSQENLVRAAVLGIGLNVETLPVVEPTEFVPRVTSLAAHCSDPGECRQGAVLSRLLTRLEANYRKLCEGGIPELMETYRDRSVIIGRRVRISSDPLSGPSRELASGRVERIGSGLELYLDSSDEPVTRGRLILLD